MSEYASSEVNMNDGFLKSHRPRLESDSEAEPLVGVNGSPGGILIVLDECMEQVFASNLKWLICQIGFGKFQLFLLLLCGWANAADAVELMSVCNRFLPYPLGKLRHRIVCRVRSCSLRL